MSGAGDATEPPGNDAERPFTVLHLAPHPDDELIGAPATLMALRDAGWRVVNLACSLGSEGQKRRRESEVLEACARARFQLRVADTIGSEEQLFGAVIGAVEDFSPSLLVAPSPHDAHPGHEAVGVTAIAVCERLVQESGSAPTLWMWGLWADLAYPTLAVPFDEKRLHEILRCLEAHRGELERNDYRRLIRGRAEMNASLGPERVFGFGSAAPSGTGREYVELLSEVALKDGNWSLGTPRWLDPNDPLGTKPARGGRAAQDANRAPEAGTHSRSRDGALFQPRAPAGCVAEWLHGPGTSR